MAHDCHFCHLMVADSEMAFMGRIFFSNKRYFFLIRIFMKRNEIIIYEKKQTKIIK